VSDKSCPICGGVAPFERADSPPKDEFEYHCETCGEFRITGIRAETLPKEIELNPGLDAALGEVIRERNAKGRRPQVAALLVDDAIQRIGEAQNS